MAIPLKITSNANTDATGGPSATSYFDGSKVNRHRRRAGSISRSAKVFPMAHNDPAFCGLSRPGATVEDLT